MTAADQLKQYLVNVVLPIASGAAANWLLIHVHLFAEFHIGRSAVANSIDQLGVFAIGAAVAWLTGHHILKGSYQPGTPAAPVVVPVEAPKP